METAKPSTPASARLTTLIPRPEAIVVPRRHGVILIEPPAGQLIEFLNTVHHGSFPGDGITALPIPALAELARRELMDAMVHFAKETGFMPPTGDAMAKPWVITGHQVELYHPGVWSKVILADALAQKSRTLAIDLLVDHDTVDHLGFAVPHFNGSRLKKTTVEWAEASALPAEFILSPQGERKKCWLDQLQQFPLSDTDSMRQFADLLIRDPDPRYVSWMSRARRTFEKSFGIDVQHVPCGYLCAGVAWHSFVLAWLGNAPSWCRTYNAALDEYRRQQGIGNPGRPMPNLAITDAEIELPFWIYAIGQPRQRLTLRHNNGLQLRCGATRIDVTDMISGDMPAGGEKLRQSLDAAGLRVRPRALTLTMFVRLLLSDLFIHGIGGALYDQMTDRIMSQLFGACPAYACASAGWLLPVAAEIDQSRHVGTDISGLKWLRHHVRGNPELLNPQFPLSGPAAELSQQRQEFIARITRLSANDRQRQRRRDAQWQERRDDFQKLHEVNHRLLMLFNTQYQQLDAQMTRAELIQENFAVAAWREYFLALHPRASLQTLVQTIRSRCH